MDIFREETDFTDIRMVQRVVDLFESRAGIQTIVRLGLIAGMNHDDEQDVTDKDDYDDWVHGHNIFPGYPNLSGWSSDRGLGASRTRSPSSVYQLPHHYFTPSCELPRPASVEVQPKDYERRAKLLEEKGKEKTEKKRLKKQKRKERKRLEKEKQNSVTNKEEKDEAQQSKSKESKPDESKDMSGVKQLASAQDAESSESSEDESSDEDSDSEELDMTSTFVSKAALILRRKLEQNPRPERKKKIVPVKEELKTFPDKPEEEPEGEKKDCAVPSSPTLEDNIKISTDLAVVGNKLASAGDFNMAVKYFTDAIKYNPTEFKLFGNRSFCFEKTQQYEKALTDAELSLSMCPGWVKGQFRRGRALAGLKRYEQAAQAFRGVLELDRTCAEAAQELFRVQMAQLMEYGFTGEQSSNALIIHGTVKKALEVLSKLNHPLGAIQNVILQPAQMANVSGVSPILSANTTAALLHPHPHQAHDAPNTFKNKPLVQNMSNVQSQPKPFPKPALKTNNEDSQPAQELFPVWVGNLVHSVTESMISNVFNKVGLVYSVKVLIEKRCAFVNFTKQEHCDEAIRRLHGFELNGMKIAVRYPDRIPPGMGIARSALRADDLQDENMRHNEYADGRNAAGGRRPFRPFRPAPEYRGNHKY
ncbi:tetratricopeptide repeat protein 31-like isoform X2 [Cottoperca gobio]|uniref:Tetratricopeptide repeat protein 31-like isoform X2 n=1 Tax=Cottoperca gobio TaxID=56716 RepID=A0A6J2RM67_COTGO|nr:tetratricopeptide repeat protein 31-like isoform X2 [Cottoperca gobio]